MFLQLLLYYTIIGNSFGTQRKKYVKRIFRGCELQNTGKVCIKTEGLLLLGVCMKGEDRQGMFVVLSRRVCDLVDKMAPELGQVKRAI
jgi:hypothetical protein